MAQSILAIAEQIEGVFRKVTYEALSEGRRIADQLGCELNALVLGDNIESASKELGQFGADRIIVAGGLTRDNVCRVINHVQPFGVDVSSRDEKGGVKDIGMMKAFIDAVKSCTR